MSFFATFFFATFLFAAISAGSTRAERVVVVEIDVEDTGACRTKPLTGLRMREGCVQG